MIPNYGSAEWCRKWHDHKQAARYHGELALLHVQHGNEWAASLEARAAVHHAQSTPNHCADYILTRTLALVRS